MPARPTLLIYAKPPRIGHAKTRLAAGLGSPVTARRLASMTLSKTLRAAANGAWSTRLYLDPPDAGLGGMELGFPIYAQGGGDLTDRLNKGLAEADPGPVLFIGSDAPDISPALIRKAIRLLQQNDAIFGPAADGGFWLFGLNTSKRTASPFGDVRWSGPNALADVKANLPASARIAMLDTLIDLDDAKDVEDWKDQTTGPAPIVAKPETAIEEPVSTSEPAPVEPELEMETHAPDAEADPTPVAAEPETTIEEPVSTSESAPIEPELEMETHAPDAEADPTPVAAAPETAIEEPVSTSESAPVEPELEMETHAQDAEADPTPVAAEPETTIEEPVSTSEPAPIEPELELEMETQTSEPEPHVNTPTESALDEIEGVEQPVEASVPVAEETAVEPEPAPKKVEPPKKKPGFFARLFGKRAA